MNIAFIILYHRTLQEDKFTNIKENVTHGWSLDSSDSTKLNICKMTKSLLANAQPVTVSHCLTINTDLTWSLCVHGKCVHIEDCKALRTLPSILEMLL